MPLRARSDNSALPWQNESGEKTTANSVKHFSQSTIYRYWPLLLLLAVVLFCEAAWLVYLAPTDITHYECYGLTFWLGSHGISLLPQGQCAFLKISEYQTAFHMLPVEYPPLTVLIFSLPLLAPLSDYAILFALLMTVIIVLIYMLLRQFGTRGGASIFLLYLILGAFALVQVRFDILPAACTLISLLAAERRRWRTAYIVLALGVLLKLYPLVMLPALFIAEKRAKADEYTEVVEALSETTGITRQIRNWYKQSKNVLLFFAVLIVVTGGFALLNYSQAIISPLSYFSQRPPQAESIESSVIWLSSYLGFPYHITFLYGSLNIDNTLTGLISTIGTLLTIAGILTVLWLQWRHRIDLARTMVGLTCVLISTGKVFSPQYLIWLLPLLAYVWSPQRTRRLWTYSWAIISVLTTVIYVAYYSHLPDPSTAAQILPTLPGFFELVTLRNLLILVTTLAFLCNRWETGQVTKTDLNSRGVSQ